MYNENDCQLNYFLNNFQSYSLISRIPQNLIHSYFLEILLEQLKRVAVFPRICIHNSFFPEGQAFLSNLKN